MNKYVTEMKLMVLIFNSHSINRAKIDMIALSFPC